MCLRVTFLNFMAKMAMITYPGVPTMLSLFHAPNYAIFTHTKHMQNIEKDCENRMGTKSLFSPFGRNENAIRKLISDNVHRTPLHLLIIRVVCAMEN